MLPFSFLFQERRRMSLNHGKRFGSRWATFECMIFQLNPPGLKEVVESKWRSNGGRAKPHIMLVPLLTALGLESLIVLHVETNPLSLRTATQRGLQPVFIFPMLVCSNLDKRNANKICAKSPQWPSALSSPFRDSENRLHLHWPHGSSFALFCLDALAASRRAVLEAWCRGAIDL